MERLKHIHHEVAVFPQLASCTCSALLEKPEVPLSLPCTKGHPQALETFSQRAAVGMAAAGQPGA